jgi:hypothetical protein
VSELTPTRPSPAERMRSKTNTPQRHYHSLASLRPSMFFHASVMYSRYV